MKKKKEKIRMVRKYIIPAIQICTVILFLGVAAVVPILPIMWIRVITIMLLVMCAFSCWAVLKAKKKKMKKIAFGIGIGVSVLTLAGCILLGCGHITLQKISAERNKQDGNGIQGVEIDWKKQSFCCYISGIEGKKVLSQKKVRYSDVNILVVVNPSSHEILLVNTPRDTLLTVTEQIKDEMAGMPEKLDAMPLHGKHALKNGLESLYQVKIHCSLEVDYQALKKVVNALDGVCVYSECDFVSDWGPRFKKGENQVDGKQALAFVRERHHLPEGDMQRGRNQQALLKAIFEKIKEKQSLTLYHKLLEIFKDNMSTDISLNSLEELIQWQIADREEWKIICKGMEGEPSAAITASSEGQEIYVFLPEEESVAEIREQIHNLLE